MSVRPSFLAAPLRRPATRRSELPLFILGGLVCGAVECALLRFSPMLALAVTGAVAMGLFAYLWPMGTATTLGFLTALFPKAGVKVEGFPFPVFLFGLVLAVLLLAARRPHREGDPGEKLFLLYLGFISLRVIVFLTTGAPVANVFAFVAWSTVPAGILFLLTRSDTEYPRFVKGIEFGFVGAVLYGLLQFAFGVQRVAVAGLTYAYGDDIASKNNHIYVSGLEDFSKIPSTYQNGNIFGVVAAAIFALSFARISRTGRRMDYVLLVASAVAIALSGSRTAVLAAGVAFVLVYTGRGTIGRKVGVAMLIAVVVAVVLVVQPGLVERYSIANVTASRGAGRFDSWGTIANELSVVDYLIGTWGYRTGEGWPGVVMQLGLIGGVLLGWLVWSLTTQRTFLRIGLVALLTAMIVDSSYQLFPTWFLVAALAAYNPSSIERAVHTPSRAMRRAARRLRMAPS